MLEADVPEKIKTYLKLHIVNTTSHLPTMAGGIEAKPPGVDWKFRALTALDLNAATAKLRQGQASSTFTVESGLSRCDTIQLASNEPNEDHMVYGTIDVGTKKKWHCWGIYDGHA